MSIALTIIRLLIAIIFVIIGIFNIATGIWREGNVSAGFNMFIAPLAYVFTNHFFPTFMDHFNSELILSLVLGIFCVGGMLFTIFEVECISGWIHGISWILFALVILDLNEIAAPFINFFLKLVGVGMLPIFLPFIFIVALPATFWIGHFIYDLFN